MSKKIFYYKKKFVVFIDLLNYLTKDTNGIEDKSIYDLGGEEMNFKKWHFFFFLTMDFMYKSKRVNTIYPFD